MRERKLAPPAGDALAFLAALGFLWRRLVADPGWRGFDRFTGIMLFLGIVLGAFGAASVDQPFAGLAERLSIGTFLRWGEVMAVGLLLPRPRRGEGESPDDGRERTPRRVSATADRGSYGEPDPSAPPMAAIAPTKSIWLDGQLLPWADAKVHVLSHGLHYGFAIFEGIRCHRTDRGTAVFRLEEHLDRFRDSAKIYAMPLPYPVDQLSHAVLDLVHANGGAEAYIRPIAFSGYGEMGLDPTGSRIQVAIAMWPWGAYLGDASGTRGVRATVSSWTRIDSRSLPPQAKCAANYANGILAKLQAKSGGYDEAILLNPAGIVAEGPGENIFRVRNGVLSTPPASSGILRGVTRDTVITLAQEEGIALQRTGFTREELFTSDELFFTGTAAGVTPIREVDGRPIGDGSYPMAQRLHQLYENALRGRLAGHERWLTYVP